MNKLAIALPLALLAACSTTVTPNYDAKFGQRGARSQIQYDHQP